MDNKQTAQMVAWLDEERRKDKALIIKLEERYTSQAALFDDQARRLQAIEGEMTSLRTTSITISMFDEALTRLRSDIAVMIAQSQSASAPDQDIRRLQETIREGTAKAIEQLRQELFTRVDRELQSRRAEEERLSRVAVELQNYADNLSKNLDEFQRSLSFLEEQRRQDSRRLSDIGSESAEVIKRLESHQTKSELLEEITRRNERSLSEMVASVQEVRQQQQARTDKEIMAEQQREKLLTDGLRRLEENLKTLSKQSETWKETYRTMKKQVDDFERLADRIERRLNEVAEVQRLSEERFRHEWEEYQQDEQKRFRQFTLTNEESWRENNKLTKTMSEQLARLMETSAQLSEQNKLLSNTQKDTIEALLAPLQALRDQTGSKRK